MRRQRLKCARAASHGMPLPACHIFCFEVSNSLPPKKMSVQNAQVKPSSSPGPSQKFTASLPPSLLTLPSFLPSLEREKDVFLPPPYV